MNLPPRSKTTANCRTRHVGSSRAPRSKRLHLSQPAVELVPTRN
jgi:hypothetical protein